MWIRVRKFILDINVHFLVRLCIWCSCAACIQCIQDSSNWACSPSVGSIQIFIYERKYEWVCPLNIIYIFCPFPSFSCVCVCVCVWMDWQKIGLHSMMRRTIYRQNASPPNIFSILWFIKILVFQFDVKLKCLSFPYQCVLFLFNFQVKLHWLFGIFYVPLLDLECDKFLKWIPSVWIVNENHHFFFPSILILLWYSVNVCFPKFRMAMLMVRWHWPMPDLVKDEYISKTKAEIEKRERNKGKDNGKRNGHLKINEI